MSSNLYIDKFKKTVLNPNIVWDTDENTDMWVLDVFGFDRTGTFIDAGAAGRSNSYNLETHFNWSGICLEPHEKSYKELVESGRKLVLNKCLYGYSGEVEFYECNGIVPGKTNKNGGDWVSDQLSCIPQHIMPWHENDVKSTGKLVRKTAVTISELLATYNIQTPIELLLMDIEGSEESVIETLPFDSSVFLSMVIENGLRFAELLYNNNYYMVENPYREKPYYDYYFLHESMIQQYPHKIYSLSDIINMRNTN